MNKKAKIKIIKVVSQQADSCLSMFIKTMNWKVRTFNDLLTPSASFSDHQIRKTNG